MTSAGVVCDRSSDGRGVEAQGGHRVILRTEFPLELEEADAMTAPSSTDPARFWSEQLAQASPDLLQRCCPRSSTR